MDRQVTEIRMLDTRCDGNISNKAAASRIHMEKRNTDRQIRNGMTSKSQREKDIEGERKKENVCKS